MRLILSLEAVGALSALATVAFECVIQVFGALIGRHLNVALDLTNQGRGIGKKKRWEGEHEHEQEQEQEGAFWKHKKVVLIYPTAWYDFRNGIHTIDL